MSESTPLTLTHQLIGDLIAIQRRLEADPTPTNRRELVRATFSAVEGLLWQLRRFLLTDAVFCAGLTVHEEAALMEESYTIDERGNVRPQPRFFPIATTIRLVAVVVQKYRPKFVLDLSHSGWKRLRDAIEVRNRVVHPKSLEDLDVSSDDVGNCIGGFFWFLAFVIEVMQEHVDHVTGSSAPPPS